MRRKRLWVSLLGAALALAAAIGVGWKTGQPSAPVWWLPDDTMLALDGVTYGQKHRILHGTWWQKALLLVLPDASRQKLEQRFGCTIASHTSEKPNTLVLWIYRRASAPGPGGRWAFHKIRSVVFDEHGHEFETGGWGHSLCLSSSPTETLSAVEVPVFPRRGKTIGVRIYQLALNGQWLRVASCIVPNPAPGPYPTWTPQPLPLTSRTGPLAFTLTELKTGLPSEKLPRLAAGREAAWTRATFRAADREGRPAAWEPVGITITDATGNGWMPRASFADRRFGAARLYFVGAPWAEEAAWKLRVEFARTAGFSPAELWTVRGLPVPGLGRHISFPQPTTRGGVIVQASLFVPPLTVPAAGWRKGVPRAMLFLSLPTEPTGAGLYNLPLGLDGRRLTLVRATNERGEAFPTSELVQTHTDREYEAELRIPPGSKSVNLTFALHRTRAVTFLTKPPTQ